METQTLFQNLDIQLFWLINTARSPFLDSFYVLVTNLGSGWVAIPVLAVVVSFLTPRSSVIRALVFIAVAMTVCGLTNSAIKHSVSRQRPLKYFTEIRHERLKQGEDLPAGPGPESLVPYVLGAGWKYRSFPSGHANTAFSAAMILFLFYGGWWWLSFVAASLVAYSRVYVGVHFPFDVAAGAFLGAVMVSVMYAFYTSRTRDFTPSRRGR